MTDQGLRDAGIHTIHAHVVAIIGSPAQSQLRKVAGAYHHTTHLVGKVHQNLRTLACLRILIGYIMHAGIMTDILKCWVTALAMLISRMVIPRLFISEMALL